MILQQEGPSQSHQHLPHGSPSWQQCPGMPHVSALAGREIWKTQASPWKSHDLSRMKAQETPQAYRPPTSLSATLAAPWFLLHVWTTNPSGSLPSLLSSKFTAFVLQTPVNGCSKSPRNSKQPSISRLLLWRHQRPS